MGLIASITNNLNTRTLRIRLLDWYHQHRRDLPWRHTRDPYRIWLSEVLLQQTRVDQGTAYYLRFLERFPSLADLAEAKEEEVLKYWEGLGYYSRARNFHQAARQLHREKGGAFPHDYQAWLKLKGVGPYTAAAVSSIAFAEPAAVLDGNVFRVISRLYDDPTPIDKAKSRAHFQALAQALLDESQPGDFNQAIMELGATVCLPRRPLCSSCPWNSACQALKAGTIADRPHKTPLKPKKERFLHYLYLQRGEEIAVQRRKAGIWRGLFEFPLREGQRVWTREDLGAQVEKDFDNPGSWRFCGQQRLPVHLLSHQRLHLVVFNFAVPSNFTGEEQWQWLEAKALQALAFPRPLRRFLDEKQLFLPFG